ncbi:MAG: hypothetical protein JXA98_07980 [Methanosarcinaceae archaeon]|nr:hypothetical protein [Methanosarcinaceae archaeon]
MLTEILSYKESFLSLFLKMVTTIFFAIGTYYFYQARQVYGGEIQKIANLLFAGGIAGLLATTSIFFCDKTFLLKWSVSILILIFALISVYVAFLVRNRLVVGAKELGIIEED